MEKRNLVYLALVVTSLIVAVDSTSGEKHNSGLSCDWYNLVSCGDDQNNWMLCRPRNPGYMILNARLDVRFPNKHCEQRGGLVNFGLSMDRHNLWTVNNCYGTFLLCLIKDPDQPESENESRRHPEIVDNERQGGGQSDQKDPTVMSYTSKLSDHSGKDNPDQSTDKPTAPNATSDSVVPHANASEETVDIDSVMTDIDKVNVARSGLLAADNGYTNSPRMSFTVKYWLIFGVVTGGVTIIGLIAFIVYLVTFWSGESYAVATKRKARRSRATNRDPSEKYFRSEKHSTSTLLATDIDPDDGVYSIIPVRDQDLRVTDVRGQSTGSSNHDVTNVSIDRKEHRIVSVSRRISVNNQPVIEAQDLVIEDEISKVDEENGYRLPIDCKRPAQSTERTDARRPSENFYHCLKDVSRQNSAASDTLVEHNAEQEPAKRESSLAEAKRRFSERDTEPPQSACAPENEYDTLRYDPRVLMLDSTYNHLPGVGTTNRQAKESK